MTIGELFQRFGDLFQTGIQGIVNTELTTIGVIIIIILFFGTIYFIGQKYFDWLGKWVENFKNPFIKFIVYIILSAGVLALIFFIIILGFLNSGEQL